MPSLVGRAWSGAVQCVCWPKGPFAAACCARSSHVPSSSPNAASGGRTSAAIAESGRSLLLESGEPRPDRVVERSLHVAGHDRVPFRACTRARRLLPPRLSSVARRSPRRSPAARRAARRARRHPRRVHGQERRLRAHVPRQRHVRLHPGRSVRLHAAALRLLPDPDLLAFDRSWLAVGLAQIAVAVATALLVFEIGTAARARPASALVGALLATLHPYLVWHDVHLNREILDRLLAAALVLLALVAAERERTLCWRPRSAPSPGSRSSGTRASRCCRSSLALYVAWRRGPGEARASPLVARRRRRGARASRRGSSATRSRSAASRSRPTRARSGRRTTRTRTTCSHRGGWIDDVPALPGAPPWPEDAARPHAAGQRRRVDECAQMRLYRDEVLDFWREQPGEKVRLARPGGADALEAACRRVGREPGSRTCARHARRDGRARVHDRALRARDRRALLRCRGSFVVLALLLLAYKTLAAVVFAGTTRYRVPWDFLLALLAAFALAAALGAAARRRRATPPRAERAR